MQSKAVGTLAAMISTTWFRIIVLFVEKGMISFGGLNVQWLINDIAFYKPLIAILP